MGRKKKNQIKDHGTPFFEASHSPEWVEYKLGTKIERAKKIADADELTAANYPKSRRHEIQDSLENEHQLSKSIQARLCEIWKLSTKLDQADALAHALESAYCGDIPPDQHHPAWHIQNMLLDIEYLLDAAKSGIGKRPPVRIYDLLIEQENDAQSRKNGVFVHNGVKQISSEQAFLLGLELGHLESLMARKELQDLVYRGLGRSAGSEKGKEHNTINRDKKREAIRKSAKELLEKRKFPTEKDLIDQLKKIPEIGVLFVNNDGKATDGSSTIRRAIHGMFKEHR